MNGVNPPLTMPTTKPSRLSVRTNVRAPGRQPDPGADPVDRGLVEPGEQPDALAQRTLEVQLAGHRPRGRRRHLGPAARLVGEQLDDLVHDQRRVDVHDDEPLGAAFQPVDLHGDVDPLGLRHLAELAPHGLDVAGDDDEVVRGDRVGGQPDDPVDVAAGGGDRLGHRGQRRRGERAAEHGHGVPHQPGAARGAGDPLEVDLHPVR